VNADDMDVIEVETTTQTFRNTLALLMELETMIGRAGDIWDTMTVIGEDYPDAVVHAERMHRRLRQAVLAANALNAELCR
jgi:hypothetical protein